MSGLLYKNFRINRSSFIFSLCTAAVCCLTLILLCLFAGSSMLRDEEGANNTALIVTVVYYMAFMLPAMTTIMIFQADESRICTAFAMGLPQGAKGHVLSKYYYLLITNTITLFMLFVCDTILTVMLDGLFSALPVLVILFGWRLMLMAVEIPFIIRFGSQRGLNIKGAMVGILFAVIAVYFLFGDISWLNGNDDPIKALIAWLQSGDLIFWLGLFPFLSGAAYYISYRISVGVYRKGAENYEQ